MFCMFCMSRMSSPETVAIRFPKALWKAVRVRAMLRGETGLSWLSRCAELCLRTAGGEGAMPGVTAGMVEPAEGSDVAEEPPAAKKARLQGLIDGIQGRPRQAAADAARWRGREGEDDQSCPEEDE